MSKGRKIVSINTKENNVQFDVERRHGDNRRTGKHNLNMIWRGRGQRLSGRREGDLLNTFVDRYSPRVRYCCIGLLILSVLDAFFTLRILEKGGVELNPLMNAIIAFDMGWFLFIKITMTASALCVLLIFYHFSWLRVLRVSYIIYGIFVLYAILIQYELYLLWMIYS